MLTVSFAFGSTVSSLVAGASFVLFTAPYDIGDRVIVEDIDGSSGKVGGWFQENFTTRSRNKHLAASSIQYVR